MPWSLEQNQISVNTLSIGLVSRCRFSIALRRSAKAGCWISHPGEELAFIPLGRFWMYKDQWILKFSVISGFSEYPTEEILYKILKRSRPFCLSTALWTSTGEDDIKRFRMTPQLSFCQPVIRKQISIHSQQKNGTAFLFHKLSRNLQLTNNGLNNCSQTMESSILLSPVYQSTIFGQICSSNTIINKQTMQIFC